MITLSLILTLSMAVEDPRIELMNLRMSSGPEATLELVDRLLASNPDSAYRLGLSYLRADLLEALGHPEEAFLAFAEVQSATPLLKPFSRFRLAQEQDHQGHPEVAAGLVATLLASNAPNSLRASAVRLLRRTVARGGDCRLLDSQNLTRLSTPERRGLRLAQAGCSIRAGDTSAASDLMLSLLREEKGDEIAREAVEWVASMPPARGARDATLLVGLTLFQHREFSRAIRYLESALQQGVDPGARLGVSRELEARYALARCYFWLEKHADAAGLFVDLTRRTHLPRERARAFYQAARCYELLGDWQKAANFFRTAYNVEPNGSWADTSLFATLRLEWRTGNEAAALKLLDLLISKRQWNRMAVRAALFLSASDLVRGRSDRVGPWLALAEASRASSQVEAPYWRGRQLELLGQPDKALDRYLRMLRRYPHHPLSRAALERIHRGPLRQPARAKALALAKSSQLEDLHSTWLILGDTDRVGYNARKEVLRGLQADRVAAPFLSMAIVPVDQWPLWQASLREPEEILLALGMWREGASKMRRHFPVTQPALAFTGSQLLAQDGAFSQSLRLAEVLQQRIPRRIPHELLPIGYQRLLYPSAYGDLIGRQAMRFNIEPALIRAVIREESRYKPEALSGAAARGLTQFVMPTARNLALRLGMGRIQPKDLYDPAIAITLGAAYLSKLKDEFGNSRFAAVAAYNAGEPQAHLWQRYCYTQEPEEYFSKVGFRQTRNYIAKVMTSYSWYQKLYKNRSGDSEGSVEMRGAKP